MKKGDSCTFMRKGIPMANKEPMQTKDRHDAHKASHPNDDGVPKNKGITWGKAGKASKKLDEFYKTHIYTYIDKDMNRAWIRIAGNKEEEE
jgi:hypothetical protein